MTAMPMFVMQGPGPGGGGEPTNGDGCGGPCIDLEPIKDLVGCLQVTNHAEGVTAPVMAALLDNLLDEVYRARAELNRPTPAPGYRATAESLPEPGQYL